MSLLVLSVGALLWHWHQRRWQEGAYWGTVVIVGSLLAELLKTAFERARPSALPPLLTGNSFPSGHVIGAVLLVGAMSVLLSQQRLSTRKKGVGITMLAVGIVMVVWQRLYLMHHWLSDVVGSVLLGGAWFCFALARPENRSMIRHFASCGVVFCLGYPVFYYFPAIRIPLPSVVTNTREPLLTFSSNDVHSAGAFQGAWGQAILHSIEPKAWVLYGEASLEVQLPQRQAYTVQFAARPPAVPKGAHCSPLEVSINQQFVQRFVLQGGWRHYEFHLDPSLLQVGANILTFRTKQFPSPPVASPREAVAFQSVALFVEGK